VAGDQRKPAARSSALLRRRDDVFGQLAVLCKELCRDKSAPGRESLSGSTTLDLSSVPGWALHALALTIPESMRLEILTETAGDGRGWAGVGSW
jgi:hypothetical protein